MIVKFSIRNFGPVREQQQLNFEAGKSVELEDHYVIHAGGKRLLKLALIHGANASGKSTVLQALDFLRDLVMHPLRDKTEPLVFAPFLFDRDSRNQSSGLGIEFIQEDTRYHYRVEFNTRAIVSEELIFFDPKKATVFKRTTDEANQFASISFGSKVKLDRSSEKALESNTLWNATVLGGFLKTNIELPHLKAVTDWFKDYLKPMVETDTDLQKFVRGKIERNQISKSSVIAILQKADFNISDISISEQAREFSEGVDRILAAADIPKEKIAQILAKPEKKINIEHRIGEEKYLLPFELESEGTQRYFGFAGLLSILINESAGIPVDELESSLHPDLYGHFLLAFLVNSKSSQLIATTHNREILGNRDLFRNDVIWFTEKNESGATELYSLADFDSSVIRDTSSVYNAYRIGKLGAVPHLGDHFIDKDDESK